MHILKRHIGARTPAETAERRVPGWRPVPYDLGFLVFERSGECGAVVARMHAYSVDFSDLVRVGGEVGDEEGMRLVLLRDGGSPARQSHVFDLSRRGV